MGDFAVNLPSLVLIEIIGDDPFREYSLQWERARAVNLDGDFIFEESVSELGVLGVEG